MTTKYIYNKKFPDIDEIVLTKVTNISEYGVNVLLTEYGNIEGFMNCTEVSRKKRVNLNSLLVIGKEIPLNVIRVDKEKKLIDLSKRTISEEDIKLFDERHILYVKLYKLFTLLFMKCKNIADYAIIDNEELYNFLGNTLWKIQQDFNNNNELIITKILNKSTNQKILDYIDFKLIEIKKSVFIDILNHYIDTKVNRVKPELTEPIKLTTLHIDGLEHIKYVLDYKNFSFYSDISNDFNIEILSMASSIYNINIKQKEFSLTQNKSINQVFEIIKEEIKNKCSEKNIKNNIVLSKK